jgi:hypothetical protein
MPGRRERRYEATNFMIYSANFTHNEHNNLAFIQIKRNIEQKLENQSFTINGICLPQKGTFNKFRQLALFSDRSPDESAEESLYLKKERKQTWNYFQSMSSKMKVFYIKP